MTRLQIEISLGLLLVLISSTALVFIGIDEQRRMEHREGEQIAEAIEVGAGLFEGNCSGCHGVQGKGIPGLAPALNAPELFTSRLQEVGWGGTLEDYIESTISNGRLTSTRPELYVGGGVPAMPAWSQDFGGPLRPDQIRDITQYILNFKKTAVEGVVVEVFPTPTPIADTPEARGLGVYNGNGCGACHAITGVSEGVVGPNLNNLAEVAATREDGLSAEDYIRKSIVAPNSFIVEGFNEGIMPQNFGDLPEAELNDLVAYMMTLR